MPRLVPALRRHLGVLGLSGLGLVATSAACSSSSGTGSFTPISALIVPADALTRARGCGPEKGKVFKYAAVVNTTGAAPVVIDAGPTTGDGGPADAADGGDASVPVDPGTSNTAGPAPAPRDIGRGVYDCFVDATFKFGSEITYAPDGSATFRVDVVAFDATEYEAQKASVDPLADPNVPLDFDAFQRLRGELFLCEGTYRPNVATTAECRSLGRR